MAGSTHPAGGGAPGQGELAALLYTLHVYNTHMLYIYAIHVYYTRILYFHFEGCTLYCRVCMRMCYNTVQHMMSYFVPELPYSLLLLWYLLIKSIAAKIIVNTVCTGA